MSSLLVVIPDALSHLISKGEITPRYYNPGDLFDDVHVLMINNDRPDATMLKGLVGSANLHLHNLPIPPGRFFHKTLGWRPFLLRSWASEAVVLAKQIKPSLVRAYSNNLNGYVASEIKRVLGIPYLLSLHTRPDENRERWTQGWKSKVFANAMRSVEATSIENADVVLPVYESILRYTEQYKNPNIVVAYNAVSLQGITGKKNYALGTPPRILTVGNLMLGKCPDNLILALHHLERCQLDVIGKGEKAEYLKSLAQAEGLADRVNFISSKPNHAICSAMYEYDIFASHCDYDGIPKAVMEPMLAGLPVVVNRREGEQVPEYVDGKNLILVNNTPQGYASALQRLLGDDVLRKELGQGARMFARKCFDPEIAERKVVEISEKVIAGKRT
ncbi:MAG: glycosyltransferase family 4 protein [Pseudodesulfovibrio sp.]|nr:glycosyltransferase family 4 protein [Pseudodesulfovibrio sp.]